MPHLKLDSDLNTASCEASNTAIRSASDTPIMHALYSPTLKLPLEEYNHSSNELTNFALHRRLLVRQSSILFREAGSVSEHVVTSSLTPGWNDRSALNSTPYPQCALSAVRLSNPSNPERVDTIRALTWLPNVS